MKNYNKCFVIGLFFLIPLFAYGHEETLIQEPAPLWQQFLNSFDVNNVFNISQTAATIKSTTPKTPVIQPTPTSEINNLNNLIESRVSDVSTQSDKNEIDPLLQDALAKRKELLTEVAKKNPSLFFTLVLPQKTISTLSVKYKDYVVTFGMLLNSILGGDL